MKICNFLTVMLMFGLLVIVGCSDEEIQDVSQNETPTVTQKAAPVSPDQQTVSFSDTYNNFSSQLDRVKAEIQSSGPLNFEENVYIKTFMNASANPQALRAEMDANFATFSGKDVDQCLDILLDMGRINSKQHRYLSDVYKNIEYKVSKGEEKADLMGYVNQAFDTNGLNKAFTPWEIAQLQLFGLNTMSVIDEEFRANADQKGCGLLKKVACGFAATAAVAATLALMAALAIALGLSGGAAIPAVLAAAGAVCAALEALGAIGDLSELECLAAISIGVWTLVYKWCCGDVEECEFSPDPCCDKWCPPGYMCEEGNCVKDPTSCYHTGCPEGYICINGNCVRDVRPDCGDGLDIGPIVIGDDPFSGNCPPGEICINGECVPL